MMNVVPEHITVDARNLRVLLVVATTFSGIDAGHITSEDGWYLLSKMGITAAEIEKVFDVIADKVDLAPIHNEKEANVLMDKLRNRKL